MPAGLMLRATDRVGVERPFLAPSRGLRDWLCQEDS